MGPGGTARNLSPGEAGQGDQSFRRVQALQWVKGQPEPCNETLAQNKTSKQVCCNTGNLIKCMNSIQVITYLKVAETIIMYMKLL